MKPHSSPRSITYTLKVSIWFAVFSVVVSSTIPTTPAQNHIVHTHPIVNVVNGSLVESGRKITSDSPASNQTNLFPLKSVVSNETVPTSDVPLEQNLTLGIVKNQLRSIQYFSKENSIRSNVSSLFDNGASASGVAAQLVHVDDSILDIDSLTDDLEDWEAPMFFRQNYPYYQAGYDDEDRPVWVAEMGKYDARPLFENDGKNIRIMEQYAKQGVYRVIKSIRERSTPDRNVTEAFYMIDLDGLSLFHLVHTPSIMLANKLGRRFSNILEQHFGGAIIINANYLANILINTMRPVYGRVMEKVEVYGTQQAKWMPALQRIFPPQSIPSWYGGSSDFKPVKIYG